MTSCREELRYTGRVESSFRKSECGAQAGTAGPNDYSIVLVVLWNFVSIFSSERNWHTHTITGYLWSMNGDASLARNGWLAMIRARKESVEVQHREV